MGTHVSDQVKGEHPAFSARASAIRSSIAPQNLGQAYLLRSASVAEASDLGSINQIHQQTSCPCQKVLLYVERHAPRPHSRRPAWRTQHHFQLTRIPPHLLPQKTRKLPHLQPIFWGKIVTLHLLSLILSRSWGKTQSSIRMNPSTYIYKPVEGFA